MSTKRYVALHHFKISSRPLLSHQQSMISYFVLSRHWLVACYSPKHPNASICPQHGGPRNGKRCSGKELHGSPALFPIIILPTTYPNFTSKSLPKLLNILQAANPLDWERSKIILRWQSIDDLWSMSGIIHHLESYMHLWFDNPRLPLTAGPSHVREKEYKALISVIF